MAKRDRGPKPEDMNGAAEAMEDQTVARREFDVSPAIPKSALTVGVHYEDGAGDAQTVTVKRGQPDVSVPGGVVTMTWGETYPETLLSARFVPTLESRVPDDLASVPLGILKTAYADYRAKVRAIQAARAEAEAVADEIARRIGKSQVTIGDEVFYAKKTPIRRGVAPRYPLTLSEVTQRAEHEET